MLFYDESGEFTQVAFDELTAGNCYYLLEQIRFIVMCLNVQGQYFENAFFGCLDSGLL